MPRALALLILLASALMLLPACESLGIETRPGATSVFDMFNVNPSPGEAAGMAIDKYDADKRYRGTLILANEPFANEDIYQQLFLDNMKDEDPGVRAAAIRALGIHGKPDQVPLLVARLSDADVTVRQETARALQRLHNPVAIDPLVNALDPDKEQDTEVRSEAAIALGQYPDPKVLQRLIASMDDPQLAVNRNAQLALRALTGQDFGLDRKAWAQWASESKSPFAAQTPYIYPIFARGKYWYEYLPFVPRPPNESAASPAGFTYPTELASAPKAK